MPSIIENISKILDFAVKNEEVIDQILKYLVKFGYLNPQQEQSVEDILHAINLLHQAAGTTFTGKITGKTLGIMSWPRCAHSDFERQNIGGLNKWGINNLTYYLDGYDRDMTKDEWSNSIRQALNYGEEVCNIKFNQVSSLQEANIVIGLGQGSKDEFDGPSGVLAWCELPPSTNFVGQLQSEADMDENWIPYGKTGRGILLVNVICHEVVGHGLGLPHTNVPNSLMNPFYSPAIDRPQEHDIAELIARYGKPVSQPTPVPTPTPKPIPPSNEEIVVRFKNGKVSIDGYRVSKI